MQISKHNYEAYFLDFWENSLDVSEREALSRFLEENPGLQDEFLDFRDALKMHLLPDEDMKFSGKANLKKPAIMASAMIHAGNYEDFIIAELEGDLTGDELRELEEFKMKNPQLMPEFRLYGQTILRSGHDITFAGKARLKKHVIPKRIIKFAVYASVAAAILLFALIIIDPFGSAYRDEEFDELISQRKLPAKPMPVFSAEYAAGKLSAAKPEMKTEKPNPIEHPAEIYAQIEGDENSRNFGTMDAAMKFDVPEKLEPKHEIALLSTDPQRKENIGLRTEPAPAFTDAGLQDARSKESSVKERGAFGRLLANLGNQILGNGEQVVENSLVGQIAGMGRERITEIRENAPKIQTVQNDDSRKTYFTINENLRIQISKGQKSGE